MALVQDLNDAGGMFSKAGRFTSEKYIVFQRKEEIMNNKPRYTSGGLSMPEIPSKKDGQLKQSAQTPLQKLQEKQLIDSIRENDKKLKRSESQPFSKQISREKLGKLRVDKNQPPPCGYYHPKFAEIDTKPLLVFDYKRSLEVTAPLVSPDAQQRSQMLQERLEQEKTKPIQDIMRKSYTCLYELSRQLPRGEILFKNFPEPHEKRFEFVEVNDKWSKVPRTPSVPMDKFLSREELIIYKRKSYAPDYQPNHEYGKKTLGSCGAPFDKAEARKEIFARKVPYTNETYFDADKYSKSPKSNFFSKSQVPDFDRMLDRESDSKCLLPSFMQKFVNMRMTLQFPHQKMLEVNNFRDGRFLTMTSSFGKFKRNTKQRQTVSDDELEDEIMDQV